MAAKIPTDQAFVTAFEMAPVGLLVSQQRIITFCNQALHEIFGYAQKALTGLSLETLYPSHGEFEHIGERAFQIMQKTGFYSDDRIMKKAQGELFWCHVTGRTLNRRDPFAMAVWVFEDISATRPVTVELTKREREISQLLVTGKSSKQIALDFGVSHRTIEAHRARLMRKYSVKTSSELIARLLGR